MTAEEIILLRDDPPQGAAIPEPSSINSQSDFWLGEWVLTWQDGGQGTNRISAILDGKVIFESFDASPSDTFKGLSFSVYNPALDRWQQTWVDNRSMYLDFVGAFRDGKMILE